MMYSTSLPSKLLDEMGHFLFQQKEQELAASLKKLRKTKKYGACVRKTARHDDGNVYVEDIPFFEWVMKHAYIKWEQDGMLGPAAEQCVRLSEFMTIGCDFCVFVDADLADTTGNPTLILFPQTAAHS